MTRNPLAMKLGAFMNFTPQERNQLDRWAAKPRRLRAKRTLVHEGDQAGPTCLILEGWAACHKDLRNGKRQIVGLLLPGDMCGLHGVLLRSADHGITMLGDAVVSLISNSDMAAGMDANPRLIRALWWSTLVDAGISREWLLSIGQRDATTRVASFLCELQIRTARVGLSIGTGFAAPLTQIALSEAVGMTPVHLNRVLRTLREQGLASLDDRQVMIPDLARLVAFCDFDANYLQVA